MRDILRDSYGDDDMPSSWRPETVSVPNGKYSATCELHEICRDGMRRKIKMRQNVNRAQAMRLTLYILILFSTLK